MSDVAEPKKSNPVLSLVKTIGIFLVIGIVIYELLSIPVTRAAIINGPMKPLWLQADTINHRILGSFLNPLKKPLHAMAMAKKSKDDAQEIVDLRKSLSDAQATIDGQKKQIADLSAKATASADTAAPKPVAPLTGQVMPPGQAAATAAMNGTPASPASSADQKTAQYWGSMDAENAAAIAQKLDPNETARIFLAMKPDQVGEIMDALPADYNVRLEEARSAGN